jgi:hypothetical protein
MAMPRFEQREVMSREWAELLDHVCRRLENGEAAADAINDLAASGVVFFFYSDSMFSVGAD